MNLGGRIMRLRTLLPGALVLALVLFAWPATVLPQPMADYGDAPDPTFPSLFASNGPRHLNLANSFIGVASTAEPNALVPNLDADDGNPIIFASMTKAGVWMGWVYFPVTLAMGAVGDHYINILLDANSSGSWCDVASPKEWIVRNYKLPASHLPGQTVYYCLGGFTWISYYDDMHWLRITLSERTIVANVSPCGWNGQEAASFQLGETEDWQVGWYYDPWDQHGGGTPGPIPPNRPGHNPPPVPVPQCNKTGTVYQNPPPTHSGHSGSFEICVKNTSPNHPMHITSGPTVTDQTGSPNNIYLEPLASTILQPGQQVCGYGSWSFPNPAPNSTWCDFDVEVDPQGQRVIIANLGNYDKRNDCYQTTGGSFIELANYMPLTTNTGLVVLFVAVGLVSAYFIVRRRRQTYRA